MAFRVQFERKKMVRKWSRNGAKCRFPACTPPQNFPGLRSCCNAPKCSPEWSEWFIMNLQTEIMTIYMLYVSVWGMPESPILTQFPRDSHYPAETIPVQIYVYKFTVCTIGHAWALCIAPVCTGKLGRCCLYGSMLLGADVQTSSPVSIPGLAGTQIYSISLIMNIYAWFYAGIIFGGQ